MRLAVIAVVSLLGLAACSTPPPPATPEDAAAEEEQPAIDSANPTEHVPLKVVMTDQTTTGRIMLIRGKIMNPHREPVAGVRMQIVFVSPDGSGGGKVQDIQQKELGSTIAAGDSVPFSWDVDSTYAYGGSHFLVAAYPKKLGGKDMPPPDNWKD